MDKTSVDEVLNKTIDPATPPNEYDSMSLESLALLINVERLKRLQNNITNEFVELKKRQDQVAFLHKLIKTINANTNEGAFDCSNDIETQKMFSKAQEIGVDIKEGKFSYSSDERDRLIDNIRMTADDHNVLNDMQLQTITRLTNERYESYQIARSIMKPLHDDKQNKARAIAGR